MIGLVVAANESTAKSVEDSLEERTAGTWRAHVFVHRLQTATTDKESNNADIEQLASTHPKARVLASANLCSATVERTRDNVRRLSRDKLIANVQEWVESEGLSWRANAEVCRQRGSFQWNTVEVWRHQFHRVDPVRGSRVAAAILAQLKVVTTQEMAQWFDQLPEVDHSLYFIGSDPHSGDHGLVNVLSARIDGAKLHEASRIPSLLAPEATLRLFGDAAWSGGESTRRLECLYTACDRKTASLGFGHKLSMRFAYITDTAEAAIEAKIDEIAASGRCSPRSVKSSVPEGNRLVVKPGKGMGLAFQRAELLSYVDANDHGAMKTLCKKIGLQIDKKRPLGTDGLASTIAFEHSIPRAMLPVLICGGATVTASDGTQFKWKPLLNSAHVSHPARADHAVHCDTCPMVPKRPEPADTQTSSPTIAADTAGA